jgi:hypothetical protein
MHCVRDTACLATFAMKQLPAAFVNSVVLLAAS